MQETIVRKPEDGGSFQQAATVQSTPFISIAGQARGLEKWLGKASSPLNLYKTALCCLYPYQTPEGSQSRQEVAEGKKASKHLLPRTPLGLCFPTLICFSEMQQPLTAAFTQACVVFCNPSAVYMTSVQTEKQQSTPKRASFLEHPVWTSPSAVRPELWRLSYCWDSRGAEVLPV